MLALAKATVLDTTITVEICDVNCLYMEDVVEIAITLKAERHVKSHVQVLKTAVCGCTTSEIHINIIICTIFF